MKSKICEADPILQRLSQNPSIMRVYLPKLDGHNHFNKDARVEPCVPANGIRTTCIRGDSMATTQLKCDAYNPSFLLMQQESNP